MSEILDLETFESQLENQSLDSSKASTLRNLIHFWMKSPRLDQKIEEYLQEEPTLRESFKQELGIKNRKKNTELEDHESLEYNSKTAEAIKMIPSLEVEIVLKPRSLTKYEEVEIKDQSYLSSKTKAMMAIGMTALLLGPLMKFNPMDEAGASIPQNTFSKIYTIEESNFKDHQLSQNIKSVLEELSSKKDPSLEPIAKQIVSLNLEDVGAIDNAETERAEKKEATISKISHLINSYYHYDVKNADSIAEKIFEAGQSRDLDYHILLGIIKTESDFSSDKISSTKDYSMAQINYKIWSKEFIRIKSSSLSNSEKAFLESLTKKYPDTFTNKEKEKYNAITKKHGLLNYFELQSSNDYSIDKMAEILSIIRNRHSKDQNWYARYHSSTPSLKSVYANKVNKNIRHMDQVNRQYLQDSIVSINKSLEQAIDSHGVDAEKVASLKQSLSKYFSNKYIAKN